MKITEATTIEELYSALPTIKCQGFCHHSCAFIPLYPRERSHFQQLGIKPPDILKPSCSHLTPEKRCSIYENRPMICRIYGITPRLRCSFGCEPDRWLAPKEEKFIGAFLAEGDHR